MTAPERLALTAHDSLSAGSCCFCDRYEPSETGATPRHTVYVVQRSGPRGGMAPRFCVVCLRDLVRIAEGM